MVTRRDIHMQRHALEQTWACTHKHTHGHAYTHRHTLRLGHTNTQTSYTHSDRTSHRHGHSHRDTLASDKESCPAENSAPFFPVASVDISLLNMLTDTL